MSTMINHPLRILRESLNLSLEDVARETRLSFKTVWRAERGISLNPDSRQQLCRFFGKTSEELRLIPRRLPTLQAGTTCTHAQEQYYFDLATQILEMAAWEYQWSSDVVQSKIDELRDTLKKRNAGDISRRQLIMLGVGGILLVSNPSVLIPEEIFPFVQQNIATCWKMSNGGRDELTLARQMVSSYMPTLTQLATQPLDSGVRSY